MDEIKFQNDIETLREISRKIQESANSNEALVYWLNSLPPEIKSKNYEQYKFATGPVRNIRKAVSSITKERYISYEEIEEIIAKEKREFPNAFRIYKKWYNILCPLIVEEYAIDIKNALNDIIDFTLNSLSIQGKVIPFISDFKSGKRNRGDTSCWIAFFSHTHHNQQTAKQLFLHIYNGEVEYCLYDRPLNKKTDINIIPYNTPFKVDDYLSVFNKHVPEILADIHLVEVIEEEDITEVMLMDQEQTYNRKIAYPLNQILYGPPGTGKTYHTINRAMEIIESCTKDELRIKYSDRSKLKQHFNHLLIDEWENTTGQISFVTFHQSMSYEDFIEGIKPATNELQQITYDIEPGIFKKIAEIARNNWEDAKEGIAGKLSFDESFERLKEEWEDNRRISFPMKLKGNDYTILGFTQKSIRFKKASGGSQHTLSISTLRDYYHGKREVRKTGVGIYYPPLLKKLKSYKPEETKIKRVKPYVLIIDEINRGNVSQIFGDLITLIEEDKRLGNDEALEVILPYSKEKFGVPPNLYIIGTMNTADRSVEALDTALRRRFCFEELPPNPELEELTEKIVLSENTEIELKEILNTMNNRLEVLLDKDHLIGHSYFIRVRKAKELQNVFQRNILPLLQEYFFGDYGKIGLVLGKGFIEISKSGNAEKIFADFTYEDIYDLTDKIIYKTKDVSKMTSEEFEEAIRLLLRMQ